MDFMMQHAASTTDSAARRAPTGETVPRRGELRVKATRRGTAADAEDARDGVRADLRCREIMSAAGIVVSTSHLRECGRFAAQRAVISSPDVAELPAAQEHLIRCHVGGSARIERYSAARLDGVSDAPRTTTVCPAGRAHGWRVPDPMDVVDIFLDDARLRRTIGEELDVDPRTIAFESRLGVADPFISHLLPTLLREMASSHPQSALMLDSFHMVLAMHMARTYSNLGGRLWRTTRRAGERGVVEQAKAFLTERIEENLRLDDVARHVGLSAFHFARVFKAEVGLSPRQFVIDRRLARACEMLVGTTDSIAEIAWSCGFSSQSHMTDLFRLKLGTSPGRYRSETRS